jgi:hypothetical protein
MGLACAVTVRRECPYGEPVAPGSRFMPGRLCDAKMDSSHRTNATGAWILEKYALGMKKMQ